MKKRATLASILGMTLSIGACNRKPAESLEVPEELLTSETLANDVQEQPDGENDIQRLQYLLEEHAKETLSKDADFGQVVDAVVHAQYKPFSTSDNVKDSRLTGKYGGYDIHVAPLDFGEGSCERLTFIVLSPRIGYVFRIDSPQDVLNNSLTVEKIRYKNGRFAEMIYEDVMLTSDNLLSDTHGALLYKGLSLLHKAEDLADVACKK